MKTAGVSGALCPSSSALGLAEREVTDSPEVDQCADGY